MSSGHVKLIMGAMASGKSSELQRLIKRYANVGKTILLVNHKNDTRYGEGTVCTHDRTHMPCVMLDALMPLRATDKYANANIVAIEEGQWFSDLPDFCTAAADVDGKEIIVAALNGGYLRQSFDSVSRLVSLADEVQHLTALCAICRDGTTPAPFTLRKPEYSTDLNLVGGLDMYVPTCRYHYLHPNE